MYKKTIALCALAGFGGGACAQSSVTVYGLLDAYATRFTGAPGGVNALGTVIPSGGYDTYFSLFSGIGPTATLLSSNDDGTCPPAALDQACRDSQFIFASLAGGGYTLALSVFDNFSFAENLGTGTLGDGFIGLGSYFNSDTNSFRTPAYALDFTADKLTINSATETSPATRSRPQPPRSHQRK